MIDVDITRQAYAKEHNATTKKKGNTKGEVEGLTPVNPKSVQGPQKQKFSTNQHLRQYKWPIDHGNCWSVGL